jgi:hypothetical protein
MTPITSPAEIKTYLLSILASDLGTWKDVEIGRGFVFLGVATMLFRTVAEK